VTGQIPDYVGEILGWRAFRVVRRGSIFMLGSVVRDDVWPTNRYMIARCNRGHSEGVPGIDCFCGVYAARDRKHLGDMGYGVFESPSSWRAIAEVGLSGYVIPGAYGWRAARGRVLSVHVPHLAWRYAGALQQTYQLKEVGLIDPFEEEE
jgi:hypothetical protein